MNNKCIIGKTEQKNVSSRWSVHKHLLRKNKHYNKHLQSSWNKYGESSFTFEIVEQFDSEMNFDLSNLERYWIKQHDSMNPENGYNLTEGGEGSCGYKHSDIAKEKMSKYATVREVSTETRKKFRQRMLGKKIALGLKHSEETKNKISATSKGRKHTKEAIERLIEIKKCVSKSLICVETGVVFSSISQASKWLKTSSSNIKNVCVGKLKQCKGYTFQWC